MKIHLNIKTPIQIDGEPTRFGPGEIVILKSALKVSRSFHFIVSDDFISSFTLLKILIFLGNYAKEK